MRQSEVVSKRGTAVLEAPEQDYGSERVQRARGTKRGADASERRMRRDLSEDFADPFDDAELPTGRLRAGGVRLKFRGLPKTQAGRIVAGLLIVLLLGMGAALFAAVKSMLARDERFVISSASAIEFQGNVHVTRGQLVNIFGDDIERNIFRVPLAERRAELEQMPWVAHATVMRLLPNHLKVSIVERTPVAFVRQGSRIGLVDANGVLLDMPTGAKDNAHYSFPVVTGIVASDPASTRAARMGVFNRFTTELDGSGEKISQELSEVDLSNPEDVKALVPDHTNEVLVHFGEEDFLERYRRFQQNLPEWRTQYPKLSSVDMRYERQVVLEMQPGAAHGGDAPAAVDGSTEKSADANASAVKPVTKVAAKTVAKVKPAHRAAVTPGKAKKPDAKRPVAALKHHAAVVKPAHGATQYHPTQAGHP